MSSSSEEISAAALAKRVELECQARRQLGKSRPALVEAFTGVIWGTVCVFIILSNQFQAPFLVKFLLGIIVTMLPAFVFEFLHLRRRVNAAFVLLGLPTSKH